jgi:hypothetical protein
MQIIALIILAALVTIIFQLESIRKTLNSRERSSDDHPRP